ncbi:cryptococcal mannosyltransferase 1-domain-containing protein [Haematococcus lacustris]
MPNFLVQVLALVTFLPPGKVLVSGYESSSKDSTATWLHLLQAFLDMARIPSLIVTNGALVRGEDEARIPFLARVRNEALLPLRNATVYHTALARVGRVARSAAPDVRSPDFGFPADRIIFINDVFFCWQDVLRLLLHGADLACGLDFDRPLAPEQMTRAAYDEAKQLSALRQDLLRDLTTKLTRKEFSATLASVAAQTATHASLQQLVNELATVMQPEDFETFTKEVAHAADEQLAVALKVTAHSPAFQRAAVPDLPPPGVAASIPAPAARQSATAGMWLTPKGSKNASKSVSSPAMPTATQPGAVPRPAGQAPLSKQTAAQSIEAPLTLVLEGPAPTVGPRKLEPTSSSPTGGQPSRQQLQSWPGTQGMHAQQPGPRRMALLQEAEPNQNQSASASTQGSTHTSALPASHSLPHSPSSPSTNPSSHSSSPPSTSTACSPTSHAPSSKCTQPQPDTQPTSSPSSPPKAQPQPRLQAQPRSDPQPSPPASPASPGELPPDAALLLTALLMALQPLPVLLQEVQVVDPQELDYMFYDIWVAHDISGRRFDKGGRLLQHNASAERFAAGMPFPVQCCWNGLAVINAAPFQGLNPEPLRSSPSARTQALDLHAIGERLSAMSNWRRARQGGQGDTGGPDQRSGPPVSPGPLMFRSAESPSECPASECTHFCNDLWRRGFRRMVVDPWVRMTYEPWRRDTLHDQLLGGIPMLPWAQMQAGLTDTADAGQQAPLASLWSAQSPPLLNDCCPIASDSDTVDFDACWGQPHWMNASGSMPWSHDPAQPASSSFAKRMV